MKDKINALYDLALDLNYTSLGAMAMSKLKDETLKNNIIEKFPWAKAIIISPWHYNYYHFSKDLRSVFDKTEIFQGRFIDGTQENLAGLALEAFMVTCGFKSKALEPVDPRALENLAATLGLGIIRKNSKFYTEEGSYCNLHAWIIDQDYHLDHEVQAQACPDHCSRCIRQCPVQALSKAYEKDDLLCQEHQMQDKAQKALNFNVGIDHSKYLKACNLCIEVCPYNQDRWEEVDDYQPFETSKAYTKIEDKIKNIVKNMNP